MGGLLAGPRAGRGGIGPRHSALHAAEGRGARPCWTKLLARPRQKGELLPLFFFFSILFSKALSKEF